MNDLSPSPSFIRKVLAISTAVREHGNVYLLRRFEGISDNVPPGAAHSAEQLVRLLEAPRLPVRGPWRLGANRIPKSQIFGRQFSLTETAFGLAALQLGETFSDADAWGLAPSSRLKPGAFGNGHRKLRDILQNLLNSLDQEQLQSAWDDAAKVAYAPMSTLAGQHTLMSQCIEKFGTEAGVLEYERHFSVWISRLGMTPLASNFRHPFRKRNTILLAVRKLVEALEVIEGFDVEMRTQVELMRSDGGGGSAREVFIRTSLAHCYEEIFGVAAGRSTIDKKSGGPFVRFAHEFFKCVGAQGKPATIARAFSKRSVRTKRKTRQAFSVSSPPSVGRDRQK